ncbi:hypothetical protein FD17_GL000980 [Lentilactobacillus sunkii DSM 19904]|uniref:Uncharacterized protein n=1 Tax=Lentilactobacillus sunkii DSM 19904 TaxID=1423808 RepID=A0A0R1L0Y3_9LACO|nr:hypothetical protein FD17_GL000980 [Lentilactobacillus sunkii DSM 19904]
MEKNILQTIFFNEYQNWKKLLQNHSRGVRPVVKKEVRNLSIVVIFVRVTGYLSVKDVMKLN